MGAGGILNAPRRRDKILVGGEHQFAGQTVPDRGNGGSDESGTAFVLGLPGVYPLPPVAQAFGVGPERAAEFLLLRGDDGGVRDRQTERVAKQRGQSKSEVVRMALEQFLDGRPVGKQTRSALELAGDLVGSVEGPGDLSTNPKYMEGFGE